MTKLTPATNNELALLVLTMDKNGDRFARFAYRFIAEYTPHCRPRRPELLDSERLELYARALHT